MNHIEKIIEGMSVTEAMEVLQTRGLVPNDGHEAAGLRSFDLSRHHFELGMQVGDVPISTSRDLKEGTTSVTRLGISRTILDAWWADWGMYGRSRIELCLMRWPEPYDLKDLSQWASLGVETIIKAEREIIERFGGKGASWALELWFTARDSQTGVGPVKDLFRWTCIADHRTESQRTYVSR